MKISFEIRYNITETRGTYMKKSKKEEQENVVVDEKMLINRDPKKLRTKINGVSESYAYYKRSEEAYRNSVQYQMNWQKENYWVYALPLNVNYEADLILYLDSLPTLKPYVADLIRKEMKKPHIERKTRVKEYVKGDDTRRRSFSFKFSKKKDKDIIEYLQTKDSKRAYLIALLEEDIKRTKFEFPESLKEYNRTNKIEKPHYNQKMYESIYNYIAVKIANNEDTVNAFDLKKYVKEKVDKNLNNNTYATYRLREFGNTGVLIKKTSAQVFTIDKEAFSKLPKPEDKEFDTINN